MVLISQEGHHDMAKHQGLWGEKLGGDHSTAIEAARKFLPTVLRDNSVSRISPGVICNRGSGNARHVKISDNVGHVLVTVHAGSTHQELHVFTNNAQQTKLIVACAARDSGFKISFGKKPRS